MPVGKKRCPRCGKMVRDDTEICYCGWVFHRKKCPRCGKNIPDHWTTCPKCGWKFYWKGELEENFDSDFYDRDNDFEENYYDYWEPDPDWYPDPDG